MFCNELAKEFIINRHIMFANKDKPIKDSNEPLKNELVTKNEFGDGVDGVTPTEHSKLIRGSNNQISIEMKESKIGSEIDSESLNP